MRPTLCPRCHKPTLILISDGIFRCESCGYLGKSTFDEDLFKKAGK